MSKVLVFPPEAQAANREIFTKGYRPKVAEIPTACGPFTLRRGCEDDVLRFYCDTQAGASNPPVYLLGGDNAAMGVLTGDRRPLFTPDKMFAAADDADAVRHALGMIALGVRAMLADVEGMAAQAEAAGV